MRFVYWYNSSDNARHSGELSAPNRDAAYVALRKQGIHPIKVEDAPGIFNAVLGKGKRWVAITVLALGLIAALVYNYTRVSSLYQEGTSERRSQIYGDPSIVQYYSVRDWSDLSDSVGDRFLAKFAQPGEQYTLPVSKADRQAVVDSLAKGVGSKLAIMESDCPELAKMKRMVNGMKDEMANYIKSGGNAELYVVRLIERQKTEIGIYENIKDELNMIGERVTEENRAASIAKWNARNELLRSMGLKTIVVPQILTEDE